MYSDDIKQKISTILDAGSQWSKLKLQNKPYDEVVKFETELYARFIELNNLMLSFAVNTLFPDTEKPCENGPID